MENKVINDEWICQNMFDKRGRINSNKITEKYLNKHLNIKNYLNNRYLDSLSIRETLYRIKNNIEITPICPVCGNKCKYVNVYYSTFCSRDCQYSEKGLQLTLQKTENTNITKYGVSYSAQNENIKIKTQQTNMERYGGKAPACSPEVLNKTKQTNIERYGVEWGAQNKEVYNKVKQTNIEKYGVEYAAVNKDIRNKIRNTCLEKYGNECNLQGYEIKNKILEKWNEKYGSNNPLGNKDIQEKAKNTKLKIYNDINYNNREKYKETCIKKYGVDNPQKIESIKEKSKATNLIRYGETSHMKTLKSKQLFSKLMSSEEVQKKQLETKKKNGSFIISKIEQQFKEYLEQNYSNDFEYQYRSELYPFNCDFYIKSLDLYIEIQGSWTHGGHPFDENNIEDLKILNKWKLKQNEKGINGHNKYSYASAINTWTISDVNKRQVAKQHNLNYLEIFSINLNECIKMLNNYIKNDSN